MRTKKKESAEKKKDKKMWKGKDDFQNFFLRTFFKILFYILPSW
jgi:hypothetical protein